MLTEAAGYGFLRSGIWGIEIKVITRTVMMKYDIRVNKGKASRSLLKCTGCLVKGYITLSTKKTEGTVECYLD